MAQGVRLCVAPSQLDGQCGAARCGLCGGGGTCAGARLLCRAWLARSGRCWQDKTFKKPLECAN